MAPLYLGVDTRAETLVVGTTLNFNLMKKLVITVVTYLLEKQLKFLFFLFPTTQREVINREKNRIKLNHHAECHCETFGFTCKEFSALHSRLLSLHDACITDAECLEQAYNRGSSPNEKAASLFLMLTILDKNTYDRHNPSHHEQRKS